MKLDELKPAQKKTKKLRTNKKVAIYKKKE